jgi:hypothetical protein
VITDEPLETIGNEESFVNPGAEDDVPASMEIIEEETEINLAVTSEGEIVESKQDKQEGEQAEDSDV